MRDVRNAPEVQRQCVLFYDAIRKIVGNVDDLPSLFGVIDAVSAAVTRARGWICHCGKYHPLNEPWCPTCQHRMTGHDEPASFYDPAAPGAPT